MASDLEQKYINVFAASQSIKYISISILKKYNNVFTSSRSMKMNIANSVVIDHLAMSIKNVHRNTNPKMFTETPMLFVFSTSSQSRYKKHNWDENLRYKLIKILSLSQTKSIANP